MSTTLSPTIDVSTTVRELVGRYPQTRRVFEESGIDYCCGGGQTLLDAARSRGIEYSALAASLTEALQSQPDPAKAGRDWYSAPLVELIDHIVSVHHGYLKKNLPRVRSLAQKVLAAHGESHGEMLRRVDDLTAELNAELSSHLEKEEQVLFPYIVAAEAPARKSGPQLLPPFGSIENPIRQMEHEHDDAGENLAGLRKVTDNYTLPPDACPTFRALYDELQQMEADLHEHIHLENNILFPRAIGS